MLTRAQAGGVVAGGVALTGSVLHWHDDALAEWLTPRVGAVVGAIAICGSLLASSALVPTSGHHRLPQAAAPAQESEPDSEGEKDLMLQPQPEPQPQPQPQPEPEPQPQSLTPEPQPQPVPRQLASSEEEESPAADSESDVELFETPPPARTSSSGVSTPPVHSNQRVAGRVVGGRVEQSGRTASSRGGERLNRAQSGRGSYEL